MTLPPAASAFDAASRESFLFAESVRVLPANARMRGSSIRESVHSRCPILPVR